MKHLLTLSLLISCSHIVPLSKIDKKISQDSKRVYQQKNIHVKKTKRSISHQGVNKLENFDETVNLDNEINSPIIENTILKPSLEIEQMQPEKIVHYKEVQVQDNGSLKDITHQKIGNKISKLDSSKKINVQKLKENMLAQTDLSNEELERINEVDLNENDILHVEEEPKDQVIMDPPQIIEIQNPDDMVDIDPSQIATQPIEQFSAQNSINSLQLSEPSEKKSKWLNYFSKQKNRERLSRFFSNGEKYRSYIEDVFAEEGIPKELYFVGLIESGYQLKAKSKASAVGPWQFVKSTGKEYGLKVSSMVDERRDIFKATKAAALYFKDLYNIFGSWDLALSGYNAGPYRIINLITRENTRDYRKLSKSKYFPTETSDYIPKLQAVMEIYQNLDGFGITLNHLQNEFDDTSLIPLKYSLSLNTISKKLGISKDKIRKLNPELKMAHTPFYKKSSYQLRIPNHNYDGVLVSTLKNLKERNPYQSGGYKSQYAVHKVKKGQNLYYIAGLYKTTAKKIMKMNKFRNSKIYIGQKIRVPKKNRTYYTVKNGDNLSIIGKKFRTPIKEISKLNNIKKGKIFPGQKLIIK